MQPTVTSGGWEQIVIVVAQRHCLHPLIFCHNLAHGSTQYSSQLSVVKIYGRATMGAYLGLYCNSNSRKNYQN